MQDKGNTDEHVWTGWKSQGGRGQGGKRIVDGRRKGRHPDRKNQALTLTGGEQAPDLLGLTKRRWFING